METVSQIGHWQSIFENWPDSIQRRGVVVLHNAESIPFVNFLVSEGLVLVERDGPDAAGMRRAILSYQSIAVLKLSSTGELSQFQSMGFRPSAYG